MIGKDHTTQMIMEASTG